MVLIPSRPRVVVVDKIVLSPEQLNQLHSLGNTEVFDSSPDSETELVRRMADAEIAIVGWAQVPGEVLRGCPSLKLVCLWSSGFDNIDVPAATRYGVVISNVPEYATEAVAEHVFALVLSIARRVPEATDLVLQGGWDWTRFCGIELRGKTLGIVGFGRIGKRVAEIGGCLGMRVIATSRHLRELGERSAGIDFVDLEELLQSADVVTIHERIGRGAAPILGKAELAMLKPDAILINTSRGAAVDELELARLMESGKLRGAGLDVFTSEPPTTASPLLHLKNLQATPHIGFSTDVSLHACTDAVIGNIRAYLGGNPTNVVNPEVLAGRRA